MPLTTIPFSSSGDFYASLPQLSTTLKPREPVYLLLRRSKTSQGPESLIALTYIPSNAPVRAKTIFASTRATLVRELGSEKFASTVCATDEDEGVGEAAWKERDGGGDTGGVHGREALMDENERELAAVRRAEEEARIGMPQRDIGIGGSFSPAAASPEKGSLLMPVDDEVKWALKELNQGSLIQVVCNFFFFFF